MFFDDWQGIGRVVLAGTFAYAALVALLRAFGKRTLSKMNAFDFVITVALGSSLATVVLTKDIPLFEGVAAFGVLAGLQYVVAWACTRFPAVEKVVKSSPALLYYRGQFDTRRLRSERLTVGEVRAAVRREGIHSLEQVSAVVLESAGQLSVLVNGEGAPSALDGVAGVPRERP